MRWLASKLPTREQLLASRWLSPFAHRLGHPPLWHFNRRSIAKGLALGLFAGLILPIGQIVLAAFLALTARANVLVATGATLVTNPFTYPPIYFAAYRLGRGVIGTGPAGAGMAPEGWTSAWLRGVALPTGTGLLLMAIVASSLAYVLVHAWWRWRVSRRWAKRGSERG